MNIKEIATRSASVPRFIEGQRAATPITHRHISQLLLDEAAAARSNLRHGLHDQDQAVIHIVRIIGLAVELAAVLNVEDLEREIDRRLPEIPAPATPSKYSYNTDEGVYHGEYASKSAACDEAAAHVGVGGHFWVGECVDPPQPETLWRAEDWLEHVSVQDGYSGDWADGWDGSTKEQRKELEVEVQKVMAAWLDRHKLRPQFWNIQNPQRFYVAGKVGETYEIEAL